LILVGLVARFYRQPLGDVMTMPIDELMTWAALRKDIGDIE